MSKASQQELVLVLEDIKALGYDLSQADDKSALYNFIVQNASSYTLDSGLVIEHISIKHLFWLYNNQSQPTRLAPKR